jgi:hypothetical protein
MDNKRSCSAEDGGGYGGSDGLIERKELRGMNSFGGRVGLKGGDVFRDVRDESEQATEPVSKEPERAEDVEAESDPIVTCPIRRDGGN